MDDLARALQDSKKDPNAFGAVYDDQFERILARLARRVYDSEIAVDLCAETFAAAFIHRRRFRGSTRGEVVAWLCKIADRKLAGFYRHKSVETKALRKLGLESPNLTEEEHRRVLEQVDIHRFRDLVRQELEALSGAQQLALRLRVLEERPYDEIARDLGVSEEAVRARVARGLAALRQSLSTQPLIEEHR